MKPFDFYVLAWPAMAIFGATLAISFATTKQIQPSIFFAFIKSGLFFIYFNFIFDGSFTFLDDWTYLDGGIQIEHKNIGFSNLAENWESLLLIGQGEHFFYYLQNSYAIQLFGKGYYAPVALNIILTLLVAFLGKILSIREFAFSEQSSRLLFFFLLIHPDILAWSTVVNGKDISVLLLHSTLLLSISFLFHRRYLWALGVAVPCVMVLFFLRFYVPIIFIFALVLASLSFGWQIWKRYFAAFLLISAATFSFIGMEQISYALDALRNNFGNPIFGIVRVILTPIPFNTETSYAFLDLPATIHWMLIPFALAGVTVFYRMGTLFSRFFLIYIGLFLGLYSVFLELQGPRHRVQLDFAIALLQFVGLSSLFKWGGLVGLRGVSRQGGAVHSVGFRIK